MEQPKLFAGTAAFTLGFEIVYITKEFTQYQMFWHYTWVVMTLVFMFTPKIGFFYEMLRLHQNFWSRQQVSISLVEYHYGFFHVPVGCDLRSIAYCSEYRSGTDKLSIHK